MNSNNPPFSQEPVPMSRVTVYVPRDVAFDLDKMNQITKTVMGKLGCPACHSGRLIDYLIIEDFVVNSKLEVKDLPGGRL